jgi:hypothetical protein
MTRSSVYSHPITTADAQNMKSQTKGLEFDVLSSEKGSKIGISVEAATPIVGQDTKLYDKSSRSQDEKINPPHETSIIGAETSPSVSTLKSLDDDALIGRALQLEKLIQVRIQVIKYHFRFSD